MTASLSAKERYELENYRRMYALDQEQVTWRREMMLEAMGLAEGPGHDAILVTLCAEHRALREKVQGNARQRRPNCGGCGAHDYELHGPPCQHCGYEGEAVS